MSGLTIINAGTAYKQQAIHHTVTSFGTPGVANVTRGDFLVTERAAGDGGPNMSVDVALGECYVPYNVYLPGFGTKVLFSSESAKQNVAIDAADATNDRIDLICRSVDTVSSPGDEGVNVGETVVVTGTPAASPTPPSLPDYHEILAYVDVAATVTSITDADITDVRREASIDILNGWKSSAFVNGYDRDTWAYQSADDPSYVMRLASTDVSDYISEGMKVKVVSESGTNYFLVTKIEFSTNTDITLYGGTDYDLPNEDIYAVYFSSAKAPVGFPLDPSLWQVLVTDNQSRNQSNPNQNQWYNLGSLSITVPIGIWELGYQLIAQPGDSADSALINDITLSTGSASESDSELTTRIGLNSVSYGATQFYGVCSNSKIVSLTSSDIYYLNQVARISGNSIMGFRGDVGETKIYARSVYL